MQKSNVIPIDKHRAEDMDALRDKVQEGKGWKRALIMFEDEEGDVNISIHGVPPTDCIAWFEVAKVQMMSDFFS